MSKTLFTIFTIQLLIFFILCPFSLISIFARDDDFVRPIDRKLLGLKKEKLTHSQLYWHNIKSDRHPTFVSVVQLPGNSNTNFGLLNVHDNPLTLGPKLSSKLVGKAQGFYVFASQSEVGLLMDQNFAILEGKYNGSSLIAVTQQEEWDEGPISDTELDLEMVT